MAVRQTALLTRIELLEGELAAIKKKLSSQSQPHALKLEGIWRCVDFTDEDFEAAKRSLFGRADDV